MKLNHENYYLQTMMERTNALVQSINDRYSDTRYLPQETITSLPSLQSTPYKAPTQSNSWFPSKSFLPNERPVPVASHQQQATFSYYQKESRAYPNQVPFDPSQMTSKRGRELNQPSQLQPLREISRTNFNAAETQNLEDFLDEEVEESNANLKDGFWF